MPRANRASTSSRPDGTCGATDRDGSRSIPWMVLCSPADLSGPWLWRGLQHRGFDGVRLVPIESLVYSHRIEHRLVGGGAIVSIQLRDGAVVGPDLLGAVNRVGFLPTDHLERLDPADRSYATAELSSLFTSVLYGLPGRVINRAHPRGLSGPELTAFEWTVEAGRAGLPGVKGRSSGAEARPADRTVLVVYVVGDRTVWVLLDEFGAATPTTPLGDVEQACRRLAATVGVELLAVEFDCTDRGVEFVGATCRPDLRPGGEALLDAVAGALR